MKWLYYTVLLLACCRMAGMRQRQGFGIGPSFGPSRTGGAGVCGPDGRIQGSRTLRQYGGYDS